VVLTKFIFRFTCIGVFFLSGLPIVSLIGSGACHSRRKAAKCICNHSSAYIAKFMTDLYYALPMNLYFFTETSSWSYLMLASSFLVQRLL